MWASKTIQRSLAETLGFKNGMPYRSVLDHYDRSLDYTRSVGQITAMVPGWIGVELIVDRLSFHCQPLTIPYSLFRWES